MINDDKLESCDHHHHHTGHTGHSTVDTQDSQDRGARVRVRPPHLSTQELLDLKERREQALSEFAQSGEVWPISKWLVDTA